MRNPAIRARSASKCGSLLRFLPSVISFCFFIAPAHAQTKTITVGSKKFTESYVLGNIATRLLTESGFDATHRQGIGATSIVWQALKSGEIDTYPEYTGTVSEEILKHKGPMTDAEMSDALKAEGIGMTGQLGFNNTYALVMRSDQASKLGIRSMSDLKGHKDLRVKVSHEFLKRKDGWEPLVQKYGLDLPDVQGIDHGIAYAALVNNQLDVTDAYSTDAQIGQFNLTVLKDDLNFFPQYKAVFLYRLTMPEGAVAALKTLEGKIDETLMIKMNADAEKTKDFVHAAGIYFPAKKTRDGKAESAAASPGGWTSQLPHIGVLTVQHLKLVVISLFFAIIIGIPLGIAASRPGFRSQFILGTTGVIQTIPGLALLALLVPVPGFGIQIQTALLALFLYSLLPIVRNTAVGLQEISPSVRESATALGLEAKARLFKVYLPMASRTILAGIKTSAIINIGTATLAALIAQGGLGEPIISGLAIDDTGTILQGAIPAALLALLTGWIFDVLDRVLIPKGLHLKANEA